MRVTGLVAPRVRAVRSAPPLDSWDPAPHAATMTTPSAVPVSTLRLLTVRDRAGFPSLRPFVDGEDLLLGYANPKGLDPDRLLPPLSTRLIPTRAGAPVVLGTCSCGEAGCGNLSARVRRDGDHVVWEPGGSRDETLDRAYRFDVRAYLDAVDDAAAERAPFPDADPTEDDAADTSGAVPTGALVPEGLGRRVARDVSHGLGLYSQVGGSLAAFHVARVDWVSAWPWESAEIEASVTADGGVQQVLRYAAEPGESETDLAARIARDLDGRRMPRPASHG